MGIPSSHTTPLELRMNERGKLMLYFDGRMVPGVLEINVHCDRPQRSVMTVTIIGNAVRLTTDEREPIPDGVYWSPWYPGFYLQVDSSPMHDSFYSAWFDRRGEFPNE